MVPLIVPSLGSSHSCSRFHALIAALVAVALFAPADARADVRRRAYVPSFNGVSVVNLDTGGVASIYTPDWHAAVAFSPDGRRMYAAAPGAFEIFDLSGPSSQGSFWVPEFLDPTGIVVTPDVLKAYVTQSGGDVVVLNIAGPVPSVVTVIPTSDAVSIAISPDGASVYVTTGFGGEILRISTATDTVAQTIPVGYAVNYIDITPDALLAVVTGESLSVGRVGIVDLSNGGVTTVIPTGDLRNVAITPDGATALVADYEGRVLFVDLATATFVEMATDLTHLDALDSIDVEPNGLTAWFYDNTTGGFYRLDLASRIATLVATVPPSNRANGKFIGKPVFYDGGDGPDVVNTDADLTPIGFGREVIVQGPVSLSGGFTSDRTFRFNDTPQLGVSAGAPVTLTGTLLGSGFTLTGTGRLRTTSTYTLDSMTTVHGAVLEVDGTHNGIIALAQGATLSGTGAVGDLIVSSGGTVRPGAFPGGAGTLMAGHAVFQAGSTLAIDIHGPFAGLAYDRLHTASVDFDPGVTLQTAITYPSAAGDTFTILTNHNGASNPFNLLSEGSVHTLGSVAAIVRYTGGDGNDVTLQVHAAPTLAPISNSSIDEDTTYNGSVTIGDDLTPANNLNVLVTSSNQALVPDANILWGAAGSVRSLQISPAAGMSGTTTITVRVSDPNWFFEGTFVLTVNAVNDAPTASPIGPQSTAEDTPTSPIALTAGDVDSPVHDLIVTATSSDQAIVPNANIVVGGTGANRTLMIAPAANAHGIVTITVRTSDGTDHVDTSFQLSVTSENDAPFISSIGNRTIEQDATTGPISFTITDADGFGSHIVTATSSNITLVPSSSLTIGGVGGSRTLTIVPAAGQHGTATITVTVDDGEAQDTTTFVLTVNEAPEPPEPPATITYYLAEGATGPFFDTDLLLANPNSVAAPITLTWLLEGGGTITESRTLAPMSRATIKVDEIAGLEATAFSTIVTSTAGHAIAVERTMRWGSGGYGAHTEKATDPSGTTWYFAEGAAGYFWTYLLLGNPQAIANTAHVTWLRAGEAPLTRSYPLLPNSRITVDTRADAELRERTFGAKVVFDQPGVAERAMYFGLDPLWSGGHGAAGQTSLSRQWDFAEGATGSFFTTFLLLANPGDAPADVTLTFFPEFGMPVTTTYTLAAGQRNTHNIAFEHPSLANTAVATRVTSTEPIVAERAQYWGAPQWIESHSSFGVTNPGRRWALAEGRVGGDDAAQTYILLANPGADAASVTLTFLRTDGTTIVKSVDVPPASRRTVGVTGADSVVVPELVNESFGTLIESTQPIVVERSLYSNANRVIWAAGTNAMATALPAVP